MLYELQIKAFKPLLDKYQDYETNPGAEPLERTIRRFNEPTTDYYFMLLNSNPIGGIRICNCGSDCLLKQIFILPEYQGHGFAQKAILQVEALYPNAKKWCLDTILQENKLCHLYEKMGYHKSGKLKTIKPGMDLVFYEK